MINNRQAGRRRGRNNNGGGNGPRQGGGGGRGDNGNRIDSRARGNAAQLLEKYKNLASDAQRQGDRVNTEYYLQFADHYFRVLADQRGRFEDQQPRRQQNDFDEGGEEYGDEGEPIRSGEQGDGRPERADRQQHDGGDRQQGDRQRSDRQREDRYQGERADGQHGDRQPREPRADRPRRWERDERPRGDEVEVSGQRRADPPVAGEDLEARAEAVLEADAPLADPAPRRRGRPRRDAAPVDALPLDGGSEKLGVDADRLPPALGIAAANDAADDDEAPKPRRRRVRAATPEA